MFLLVIFVVLFLYFIYYNGFKPLNYWNKHGVINKPGYPFVGNMSELILRKKHFAGILQDIYNKYPNNSYVGMYQFTRPMLMVKDLNLIKQICIKDFDHFTDHIAFLGTDPDPYMSRSLISMNGNIWRDMRATLSPAFTSSKMRNMCIFMQECAENLTNKMPKDKGVIEVITKEFFTKFANDVIASTTFGVSCNSVGNPDNEFYKTARALTGATLTQTIKFTLLNMCPYILRLLRISIFKQSAIRYFVNIIEQTMAKREAENIIRLDTIHLLMEAKKGTLKHENSMKDEAAGFATVEESEIGKSDKKRSWTQTEIVAQALLFFFAGFDTISTSLSILVYELAVHTDVQDKLQEEIDKSYENSDGKVSYENILKLKYLDQVVSETLRKWPIAFQTDRLCTKDYTIEPVTSEDKRIKIEKGTNIIIPVVAFHMDPEFYPDPEKFDPERFSDENKDKIVPGTYMPFGTGPRNCIGSRFALLEMKVLIFYMLLKFDIVPTAKTKIPYTFLNPARFNLYADELFIGFKPRTITSL